MVKPLQEGEVHSCSKTMPAIIPAPQRETPIIFAFSMALILTRTAGQSSELLMRVEIATAEQRAAVALAPTDPAAYHALAKSYGSHKFMRAASEALHVAVKLAPTDPDLYLELASALRRSGDMRGPGEAVTTAVSLRPDHGPTRLLQAQLLPIADARREPRARDGPLPPVGL